ncbi:glycerate kinase-like [Daphnia pulicaria]|uniref:glycerate kinase-like n=1 Tax=Daphnia pulicaria TaxID=35523 RepID=UPI001EECAEB1|nr:glycerate kinase-like [Daphnia pulicaria]XP_046636927.1 glycerate kinase-like [Daphnia pulicaria]
MVNVMNEIRLIYKAAVDAVKPGQLVNQAVRCLGNVVTIKEELEIEVDKNCHVIGFGKAVLAMALQMDTIIGHHTMKGIISIPHGVMSQYSLPDQFLKRYTIYEGAVNNIPDEESLKATKEIEEMVSNLKDCDVLFVLISGGGSALLASPVDDLTLDDKQKTIQLLSKSGANIQELNSVRKKLSRIKGGKLAQLSYPATTVALILSDVIGNPLDVIASGPTVENKDPQNRGWNIIQKYQLENQLPVKVAKCLSFTSPRNEISFDHVRNYLIGSNLTALQAAEAHATQIGFVTAVLSDHIQGEAKEIGKNFAQIARIVAQMMAKSNDQHKHMEALSVAAENLNVDPRFCCTLERLIRGCFNTRKNLCLIGGGETTVSVRGSGLGGRNQEMVLSYLVETAENPASLDELEVVFLSAGTDGIDGPTAAAGATTCDGLFKEAQAQGLDPITYLDNNDSYNFFHLFQQGNYHLITGPSGTNVMDIHILCFNWKQRNVSL